mmetsp:Transcript_126603/g.405310  ORF Transcript_126603/g.405310 Transcript_126603/m.405310 type:complete len:210 (-) Transcript_126603:969-1598(-)
MPQAAASIEARLAGELPGSAAGPLRGWRRRRRGLGVPSRLRGSDVQGRRRRERRARACGRHVRGPLLQDLRGYPLLRRRRRVCCRRQLGLLLVRGCPGRRSIGLRVPLDVHGTHVFARQPQQWRPALEREPVHRAVLADVRGSEVLWLGRRVCRRGERRLLCLRACRPQGSIAAGVRGRVCLRGRRYMGRPGWTRLRDLPEHDCEVGQG